MRLLLAAALVLLGAPPARAGGTIHGTVTLAKAPPPWAPTKIAKDTSVCGAEAREESLRLGPGGRLADVVVALRGARPATAPSPTSPAALDQVGCRYVPRVQAVTVGTALSVINSDAVFHNVHAQLMMGDRPVTVFNVATPIKGQKLPTVMKKPGVHKVRCDAGHTWMAAWIHVFDHPWFAVTDGQGSFSIKDVPPGAYTLEYWHEPIHGKGPALARSVPVQVRDGQTLKADAVLGL